MCLIAGCGHSPALRPVPVARGSRINVQLSPQPPRALDPVTFTVYVKDAPPTARVTARLTMPDMTMPPNIVTLLPAGPGTYRGTGRFTMTGAWQVGVAVRGPGTATVQSFAVTVR